jgi:hypothetical protein
MRYLFIVLALFSCRNRPKSQDELVFKNNALKETIESYVDFVSRESSLEKIIIIFCRNYSDSVTFSISNGYADLSSTKFKGETIIKSYSTYVVGDDAPGFFEVKNSVIVPKKILEINKRVKEQPEITEPKYWYLVFKENKLVRYSPKEEIVANCKGCFDSN